jgi:hypothetical protein
MTLASTQINTVWCSYDFRMLLANRVTYLVVPTFLSPTPIPRFAGSRAPPCTARVSTAGILTIQI